MNSAQIYSINFNINSNYVILSSTSGTIHIFRMGENKTDNAITSPTEEYPRHASQFGSSPAKEEEEKKEKEKEKEKSSGWFGGIIKAVLFTEDNYESMVESSKSCLTLKKPEFLHYNICGISQGDDSVFLSLSNCDRCT